MIIELSDQFQKLANKIYTFTILFMAVTFLQINTISQIGVKFEIENTDRLSGGLAFITCLLTIGAFLCLARDFVITNVVEDSRFDDETDIESTKDHVKKRTERTFIEKYYYFYLFTAWATFFIEGMLPIILGVWVTIIGYNNMVELLGISIT